jgi:hypothetical protein
MTISAAAISTPAALRTRLPTPALAHPINRLRQLVTNSLLSPSPITVPVPPRYLTDAGHAPPATTASAASTAKTQITQYEIAVPIAPRLIKTSIAAPTQPPSQLETEQSKSDIRVKSPQTDTTAGAYSLRGFLP